MEMRDVRLAQLRVLLREENERRTALARRIKKAPAQLSQWLSGYRTISEDTAREIERHAGKPAGWLDHVQIPAAQGSITPPPSPGPRFEDRREVSESDWALLHAVKLVLTEPEFDSIRERARKVEELAERLLEQRTRNPKP